MPGPHPQATVSTQSLAARPRGALDFAWRWRVQYTLMLWHADHLNFDRLLTYLDAELRRLHDGSEPDYALMLDIMYYMTHYADVLHHPKEDIVFARMKTRDPALAASIDDLTRQHVRLREMGETMVRELNDVLNGSIEPRAQVERAARTYVDAMRAHMRAEESVILPRAERLLSDRDWTEIDAAIAHFDDPLFGSKEHDRYTRLRQQIDAERGHAP
jgi:hemerythrin-like domain-containing protein